MRPDSVLILWIHLPCLAEVFFHFPFMARSSCIYYWSDMSVYFVSNYSWLACGYYCLLNWPIHLIHSIYCIFLLNRLITLYWTIHSFIAQNILIFAKHNFRWWRSVLKCVKLWLPSQTTSIWFLSYNICT